MKCKFRILTICYTTLFFIAMPAKALWQERYFNPKPLTDDIILPMPCDGAMAFRKVIIPLNNPLDDFGIMLGQDGDDWGYLEQSRPEYISGSFSSGNGEKYRYYLMAKYELNILQYKALISDTCPTPTNNLRLPQVNVGWMDAMNFANKYNIWLRNNKIDRIPMEDGALGFLRLPTETEWEFATRGGLNVSASEFREPYFPMPDGINHYVWFAGAQSSNGKLQLVGLLKPNPLGLHDMLGNVAEMMFEPFRLNKLARQHGQAGGYIVRGGHYLTPQSDIRSALRIEESYYDNNGQNTNKMTGIRLVMVAPALTSRQRIHQIEEEWRNLGVATNASSFNQEGKTLDAIARLASSTHDIQLKQQLEKLRLDIRINTQTRDEQRDQAIRSFLQLGAFMCTKLKDASEFYEVKKGFYNTMCNSDPEFVNKELCPIRLKELNSAKKTLDFVADYYADTLVDNSITYNREVIEPQVSVVKQLMDSRGKTNLNDYLNVYWSQLQDYWKTKKISRSEWLFQCKVVN